MLRRGQAVNLLDNLVFDRLRHNETNLGKGFLNVKGPRVQLTSSRNARTHLARQPMRFGRCAWCATQSLDFIERPRFTAAVFFQSLFGETTEFLRVAREFLFPGSFIRQIGRSTYRLSIYLLTNNDMRVIVIR